MRGGDELILKSMPIFVMKRNGMWRKNTIRCVGKVPFYLFLH